MSPFVKALVATAVPIAAAMVLLPLSFRFGPLVAPGLAVAAVAAAIVYRVRGNRQVADGIFAGLGIGFVVGFISCFAIVLGSL